MTAPTSVAEMIAALPQMPDWPKYQDEVSAYFEATEPALRARLALAERVIREYLKAVDAVRNANEQFIRGARATDAMFQLCDNERDARANLRLALPALSI